MGDTAPCWHSACHLPLFHPETQPGPLRATSQLLTCSLKHLGEPTGMSLQEPWLLADMLRPVERGHGAWSPQPPATASFHGAVGGCPLLTSGHPAQASLLPLVTFLRAPGPPLTPWAPASPIRVPSRVETHHPNLVHQEEDAGPGLLQRSDEQPALPDNGIPQRSAPGQEGPLGRQPGHIGAASSTQPLGQTALHPVH